MNKTGLKLWSTNTDNYIKLAKDLYGKGIFDFIELYIVPDTLENLKLWKNAGVPFTVHMAHSAHGVDLSNVEKKEFNKKVFDECRQFADELNSEKIIVHGGTGGIYEECASQIKKFNDKRIHIENKPYATLPFVKADFYTGSTVEEVKFIMDYSGCSFCLDVGHAICSANSFNENPYSFIEKFIKLSPDCVHLSDINTNSEMDEHLNYGLGNLDFNKIIKMLNADVPIVIETNKKSKDNLDDFEKDALFLKNIVKINGEYNE